MIDERDTLREQRREALNIMSLLSITSVYSRETGGRRGGGDKRTERGRRGRGHSSDNNITMATDS